MLAVTCFPPGRPARDCRQANRRRNEPTASGESPRRELELASKQVAFGKRHELEQIDEALGVGRWLWGAREASINETETARWPALRVRPDRR